MNSISAKAFIQALGVVVYVAAVAWFMSSAERLFGGQPGLVGMIVIMLLFVLSAAVTGSLVFGRSVLWYMEGKKRQAVRLALMTILWLLALMGVGVVVLAIR